MRYLFLRVITDGAVSVCLSQLRFKYHTSRRLLGNITIIIALQLKGTFKEAFALAAL